MRVKDGVVLALENLVTSKLLLPGANRRIQPETVDRHMGVVEFPVPLLSNTIGHCRTYSWWSTTCPCQPSNSRWFPKELSETHPYQDHVRTTWILCCATYFVCLLSTIRSNKYCWWSGWRWTTTLHDWTKWIILGTNHLRSHMDVLTCKGISRSSSGKGQTSRQERTRETQFEEHDLSGSNLQGR